jgi:hypothetical protein
MKTPTNRNKLANMFTSVSVQDIPSSVASVRKGSLSSTGSRTPFKRTTSTDDQAHTTESARNNEPPVIWGKPSNSPRVQPKEMEDQFNNFTWEGSRGPGRDSPSDASPDSLTDSTMVHRVYSHSHLGHGPPPSGRTTHVNGPSAFKAKGPLAHLALSILPIRRNP